MFLSENINSKTRSLSPYHPPPPSDLLLHPIRPSIFVWVILYDPLLFKGFFVVCWSLSLARDSGFLPLSCLQDGCHLVGGETSSGRGCSSWQWVWGLHPFRAFIVYPLGGLGVDLKKLLLSGSPFTRITWHLMPWIIWFDLYSVVYLDESMAPSSLAHQTSPTAVSLPINWLVIISCISVVYVFLLVVFMLSFVVVCCVFCCCFVFCSVVVVFLCYLYAGLWVIMYIIFATYLLGLKLYCVITMVSLHLGWVEDFSVLIFNEAILIHKKI